MRKITSENIRVFSSVYHGIFAAVVVLALIVRSSVGLSYYSLVVWIAAVVSACSLGWACGKWYVPEKRIRFSIKPYIITPLISFLSAAIAALIQSLAFEINSPVVDKFDLWGVLNESIQVTLVIFTITLPVTALVGMVVSLFIIRFGGYENSL